MSFNLLEYFDKRIPRKVLEYAAERDCPPDAIVKFKPSAESGSYYALCDIDSGKEWVEIIRQHENEVTIAYAYPIQTASQRIALGARYETALELPFIPVIPAELPLIYNFRFHHERINRQSLISCRASNIEEYYRSMVVNYLMRLDEFELTGISLDCQEGFHSFRVVIERDLDTHTYSATMMSADRLKDQTAIAYSEELGHLDQAFFEKIYGFCINYGKACLKEDANHVIEFEEFVKQKRPFHDILNYLNN